jgi:plastocyanin
MLTSWLFKPTEETKYNVWIRPDQSSSGFELWQSTHYQPKSFSLPSSKMHILTSLLFFLLPTAFAAQHVVELGEDGFVFVPDTVQAAVGDTVVFEFYPGDHSVAQSTFDAPCVPAPGGIWSGFFNPSSGKDTSVWVITIADTNHIWLYCAQIGHCNAGMAMVINPP